MKHRRVSRLPLFVLLCCFSTIAPKDWAHAADEPRSFDVPWAPRAKAEIDAERALQREAMRLALAGEVETAWRLLERTPVGRRESGEPSPALIGWRALTVGGFLRNQSDDDVAASLMKAALAGTWIDAAYEKEPAEKADALFSAARLASWVSDQDRAVQLIEDAALAEPTSRRIERARVRMTENRDAFPRR